MKATGIVRKVDDLGRVVIPKEIRKNLKIKEGDPIEIYVEKKGEIILKKYSPMKDLLEISTQYVETLTLTSDFAACVTDTQTVLAIAGAPRNDYIAKTISEFVSTIISEKNIWSTMSDSPNAIIKGDKENKYFAQVVVPIICNDEPIGAVTLFSLDKTKAITNVEYKLAQSAATMLSKQMED